MRIPNEKRKIEAGLCLCPNTKERMKMKRHPNEVKSKCNRCPRERYELVKHGEQWVCWNCKNYLVRQEKQEQAKVKA